MQPNWIEFKAHTDLRGSLVAVEGGKDIPFAIRRMFYLTGLDPASVRGKHGHKRQHQVAVCLAGACTVVLDNGVDAPVSVRLDRYGRGLFLDTWVWHELRDFTPDCVLLVMAEDVYDPADLFTDHAEFVRLARERREQAEMSRSPRAADAGKEAVVA